MDPDRESRAEQLFAEALEVPPEKRREFLEQRCADDTVLRLRVEALLQAHEKGQAAFGTEGVPKRVRQVLNAAAEEAMPETKPSDMSGRMLSHYRLVEKIGEGGMGVVWKAQDTILNRTVAIKVLPADLALDEERRRMFLDEARLAASVSHAHIVQVYELGREGDIDFIVMEYVEGKPLNKLLRGNPLPPEKVANWGLQVAEGLARAHRKGLIHRDLKPANILVTPDNEVKIVDFGLAVLFERRDSTVSLAGSLTETLSDETRTRIAGTLPYMSPEQVRGEKLDARSDIFSFGTVLYEMTTGQRPFLGAQPTDIAQGVQNAQPRPVHALVPTVPLDLDRIIEKALARQPPDRYQHMDDLVVDLKRLGKGLESGSATRHRDLQHIVQAKRWSRLHTLITVTSLVGASFIAWFAWMQFTQRQPGSPAEVTYSSAAVLPLKSVSDNPDEGEYLADGLTEALITKLTQLPGLRVTPWMTAQRYRGTSRSLHDIAAELRVDALIMGSVRKSGDRIAVTVSLVDSKSGLQFWGDEFEDRLADIFAVQRRIAVGAAERLRGRLAAERARGLGKPASRSAEAYELCLRGKAARKQRTKESADLAFELFQRALALDPGMAEAHVGLADVLGARYYQGWSGRVGDPSEVKEMYERALALDPALSQAYDGLIRVYWMRGRSEECLKVGKRVANLGLEDVDHLLTQGSAYYFAGLYDRAIPLYQRVLELDPANEFALEELGLCNLGLGKCQEANDFLDKQMRRFGENARLHIFRGEALHCVGNLQLARRHYERAIELDPGDFVVYRFLGILQAQSGHPKEAQDTWKRGVQTLQGLLDTQANNSRMRAWLAQLHALLGDRQSTSQQEGIVLAEAPENGVLLKNLAIAHVYLGDTDRAMVLLRRALDSGEMAYFDFGTRFGLERFCDSPGYRAFSDELSKRRSSLRQKY